MKRSESPTCPFCAAPTKLSLAAAEMPEHRQAAEATGGERRLMRLDLEFRVTKESPAEDQKLGSYRRWKCEFCGFSEVERIGA